MLRGREKAAPDVEKRTSKIQILSLPASEIHFAAGFDGRAGMRVGPIKQPVFGQRIASRSGAGSVITPVGLATKVNFQTIERFRTTDAKPPVIERMPRPMVIEGL